MLAHDIQKYRAMAATPAFAAVHHKLHVEIVPTRQLAAVRTEMTRMQQQVAAFQEKGEGFWGEGNRLPLEGLLVVGESGSSKSLSLKVARASLPDIELPSGLLLPSKSVFIDTPGYATMGVLAREIVRCTDGVQLREPKDEAAGGKALAALARHGYTMVVIDELSRMLNPQRHARRTLEVQSQLLWSFVIEVLNLGNMPMALSGHHRLLDTFSIVDKKDGAVEVRREAQRRLNVLRLDDISLDKDGDLLRRTMTSYCDLAQVQSIVTDEDLLVPRLIHASYRQIGSALELMQKAIAMAKTRPRGKLQIGDFAIAYRLMTDAANGANPFLVEGWERIDVGIMAPRTGAEARTKEIAA